MCASVCCVCKLTGPLLCYPVAGSAEVAFDLVDKCYRHQGRGGEAQQGPNRHPGEIHRLTLALGISTFILAGRLLTKNGGDAGAQISGLPPFALGVPLSAAYLSHNARCIRHCVGISGGRRTSVLLMANQAFNFHITRTHKKPAKHNAYCPGARGACTCNCTTRSQLSADACCLPRLGRYTGSPRPTVLLG